MMVYLLKHKSDTLDAFKHFKARAEKQTGRKIKCLRDDKGGEFIGHAWDDLFAAEGIRHERTVRATPQQNGVAERRNRTLEEGVIATMQESKLPPSYWGYAL